MRKRKPVWMCEHPDTQLHLFLSHPSILTLKAVFFSLGILHCTPPPSAPPVKSFHIHTLLLPCSCRHSVVHPPPAFPQYFSTTLHPSLPLSLHSFSLYWLFRSATACWVHCGKRSQNDSRHSSLPPLPRHPSFLHTFFSSILTLGRCRSSYSPQQRRRPLWQQVLHILPGRST